MMEGKTAMWKIKIKTETQMNKKEKYQNKRVEDGKKSEKENLNEQINNNLYEKTFKPYSIF